MLKGMREPGMAKLILLANILGCSVDYLMGLTPEAQRAIIVVESDTNALKPQSSERGQTSGQFSGNAVKLKVMIAELMEPDVDLLLHIAEFIIERRKKGMLEFVKAVTAESKEEVPQKKANAAENSTEKGKPGFDDFNKYEMVEDIEFDDGLDDDDYLYDDGGDDDDYRYDDDDYDGYGDYGSDEYYDYD
jgi:hypothetical protein